MQTQTSFRTVVGMAAVAVAGALTTACAPANVHGPQGKPVPVQLVVNNNLLRPTDLTIYTVDWDGQRQLLGSVPPRTTRDFSFTPVSYSEQYRFLATRITGRDIRSQVFTIGSEMTGQINWTMLPNLVGFRGTDPDTTGTTP
ncbi:MAG: hypothetical protein ABI035_11895 [Gemmatimonadaceae bacterium]